jgi:alpha-beta hydrolase superfamily lysophospholipase
MKLTKRIALRYYKTKFKLLALFAPRKAARSAFKLFCTPQSGKPDRVQPLIFEKADKISVAIDGNLTLRGWLWKSDAMQQPEKKILILHGFDSYSYRFEKYIRPLRKEGFTIMAFDAPGHGTSDGKTINSLQYKNAILKIEESFGSLYGIMAHSIGGLASSLASEFLPNLKKLVLIAPAVEITGPIENFAKFVSLPNSVKNRMYKLIIKIGKLPVSYFDTRRAIEQVTVPTLWLHDEEDAVCPIDDVRPVQELGLPHVTFRITKGLGHSNIYRDPETVKAIVNFFVA